VKEPREIFHREVEENQWIKECLAAGESTGEYFITSEYSRHSRYCAGPGLLLVGDAFAFLDPAFRSGVMLALKSGHLAGEAIHEGLLRATFRPRISRPTARPCAQASRTCGNSSMPSTAPRSPSAKSSQNTPKPRVSSPTVSQAM